MELRFPFLGYVYPGSLSKMNHIHHFDLDLPDECYLILQAALMDNAWGIHPNFKKLRTYNYHLPKEKQLKAYEHYRSALQSIFYKRKFTY